MRRQISVTDNRLSNSDFHTNVRTIVGYVGGKAEPFKAFKKGMS